jgi:hypothetical protein
MGPWASMEAVERRSFLPLSRTELQFLGRLARSLVTILTELTLLTIILMCRQESA